MGVLTDYIGKRAGWKESDERWWQPIIGGKTHAGKTVSETSALTSTVVYRCVAILAETVASLPLPVYKRVGNRGKERYTEHPLYRILHDEPNPEMTSFAFRETLQGHLALWGNAYAEIQWGKDGQIKGLWLLRPDKTKPVRINRTIINEYDLSSQLLGQIVYECTLADGSIKILPSYRILHIPGFGFTGLKGYSPITLARQAIGLAQATEEYGARFFGDGANPGGVLETPKTLSKPAQDNLRESWNEMHSGLSNRHRIAILEQGLSYKQIGIPPDDAQFLETRKFQAVEIARFFHIPPHMIGELDRATFSNIEQQSIEFVVYTIRPWLIRWEQNIKQKIIYEEDRDNVFAEFVVDGLLRGDVESRYKAYSTARQWGWMSANDIRELENQNPIGDQGDMYLVPMNMVSADQTDNPEEEGEGQGPGAGDLPMYHSNEHEDRANRSALNRSRTASSFRRVFKDAGQRIVAHETSFIRRALKKYFAERSASDFKTWLNDFYGTFPAYINRRIGPVAHSLAEAIAPIAGEEVNAEYSPEEVDKFIDQYNNAFDKRYVDSSKGQINAIVDEHSEDPELAMESVEARLTEWEEKRPDKIAMNETVQLSNAVAKIVFASAGVTKLVWNALGSKSCPFCQDMNGKVVGIEQPFVAEGDVLEAEGKSDMKVYKPATHAPIHEGCVCQISPA